MPTINLENSNAHYREWGSGQKTIILLHGWPADSSHFQELGPMLAKDGFRVIAPDFPGWGSTPQPPKPWSVSDYKNWLHEFIQALNLSQFHLFGHSFGGRVSIKYAISHATEIDLLILCSSAGIKPDPYTAKRRILYATAKVGKKILELPGLSSFSALAKKILYRLAGSRDYLQAEGVMKDTIVKVLEEDLSALLPQIHHRTLLLWGDEDTATPLRDGQHMHKLIQNSQLTVLKGEKHSLPRTAPKKVSQAISEFIKSDS